VGGTVVVPAWPMATGRINSKRSNVNLHLDIGWRTSTLV